MLIDAEDLDHLATYRLLAGAVVPRPIAWVTSGVDPQPTNLAPFSSFAWVSPYPAMLGFNIAMRGDGRKDTARNIVENGEYVVNIADETMLNDLHFSSEGYEPDVSEVELLGLETSPCARISTRRLAAAPVSMECVLRDVQKFGTTGSEFVIGEVVAFHVRDSLYSNGKIDSELLRPLGRLGGPRYASLGTVTTMPAVPGG